ncbi:hypothetical protein ACFWJM_15985 [Streptomyces sp. NPDC127077]
MAIAAAASGLVAPIAASFAGTSPRRLGWGLAAEPQLTQRAA